MRWWLPGSSVVLMLTTSVSTVVGILTTAHFTISWPEFNMNGPMETVNGPGGCPPVVPPVDEPVVPAVVPPVPEVVEPLVPAVVEPLVPAVVAPFVDASEAGEAIVV